MATGGHFEKKLLKKTGGHFEKKLLKKLRIDLKWREMRSKVTFGHPKWMGWPI